MTDPDLKIPDEFALRAPDTLDIFRFFTYQHLPEPMRTVAGMCYAHACNMVRILPDGKQLQVGLTDLLRANDCFIRAACDIPFSPKSTPMDMFAEEESNGKHTEK